MGRAGIGEVSLQQEVCLEGRLEWPSCHPLGQLGPPSAKCPCGVAIAHTLEEALSMVLWMWHLQWHGAGCHYGPMHRELHGAEITTL